MINLKSITLLVSGTVIGVSLGMPIVAIGLGLLVGLFIIKTC